MKYEDQKVQGIPKTTLRKLEKIAMDVDYALEARGGIEGRGCDSEDFPEVSVCAIQRMLEEAYRLGQADAMKKNTGSKAGKVGYKTNGAETTATLAEWYFGKDYLRCMTEAALLMHRATGNGSFDFWQEGTGTLTVTVE